MKFLKFFIVASLCFQLMLTAKSDDGDIIQEPAIQYKHNFLPDGTEIKIEGDKIYYVCKYKLKPLDKGWYMLADGTVIKVKNGKIVSDRQKYQRPTEKKRKKREEEAAIHAEDKLMPHDEQDNNSEGE